MPLNMTQHKTKHDWLPYLSVIWPIGQSLGIQIGHGSQIFCHQSEGLATWYYYDYDNKNKLNMTACAPTFNKIVDAVYVQSP